MLISLSRSYGPHSLFWPTATEHLVPPGDRGKRLPYPDKYRQHGRLSASASCRQLGKRHPLLALYPDDREVSAPATP